MSNENSANGNLPLEGQKIEPCEHMTDYVSALSDGSLRGPAYWYTRLHLLYCPKCKPALRGFEILRKRLSALQDEPKDVEKLAPEARSALRQTLDAMDAKDA